MISEYFYPFGKGGGEISAFLLAKELAKSGIKVHVLTSGFKGLKKRQTINKVIIHRLLKTGNDPTKVKDNIKRIICFEKSLLRQVEKLDKKENFDIIHCMNISSMPAVKLKNKIKKKFVLHVNSPVAFCPKGTLMYKDKETCERTCTRTTFLGCHLNSKLIGKTNLRFYLKYNPFIIYVIRKRFEEYQNLIKKFDFYMPISSFMKKRLLTFGIAKNKVKVIYNLTDFERFFKLKQPKNKTPKILYLGPYTKPKGPHLIIKALKKIKLPYEANFYGKGPLGNDLIREAHNLPINIHKQVNYSKIPKILGEHDILVFPSLVSEAFGRVVLEACAAGKIVIASRIGGVTDIIKHNKTGLLFEPGDVNELKSLLEYVLRRDIHISLKQVKKRINKKFSYEYSLSKIQKIYKKLIKR